MSEQNKTLFSQYIIVFGLAIFLTDKIASGKLNYYINSRFFPLTVFAIIILAVMSAWSLASIFKIASERQGSKILAATIALLNLVPLFLAVIKFEVWMILSSFAIAAAATFTQLAFRPKNQEPSTRKGYWFSVPTIILSIPLLIGLFTTERSLSSSALDKRGVNLTASLTGSQTASQSMKVIEDDRTILDWVKLFNYSDDHSQYIGKSVNVIGFVYHDPRLPQGQFMLSRFVITCCVADAFAIGMPVESSESSAFADNTWLNVKGTLDATTVSGESAPMIHASTIESVPPPEQPYLYP